MNNQSRSGLLLVTREVSYTIAWREAAVGMAESLFSFFLKGYADGGASALTNIAKSMAAIREDANAGERVWRLTMYSFAWSISQLQHTESYSVNSLLASMRAALNGGKATIDDGRQEVPVTFLERPTTLPLYQLMRDLFISDVVVFDRSNKVLSRRLISKLDLAFNRAVLDFWNRDANSYEVIAKALMAPASFSVIRDKEWQSYKELLRYTFGVLPVFGQTKSKASLEDLYVPLRAYWSEHGEEAKVYRSGARIPDGATVVQLDKELNAWLDSHDEKDWLRLIGGGPGSGKSTTLKALVSKASERVDIRPLFIPLQHIGLNGELRDLVNYYFTNLSDSRFSQPPLTRTVVEDGPPLLLVFDGLDELVAPNEAASDVIATFSARLNGLVSSLRGDGARQVKVVVSGRMPAFQAAQRFLPINKKGCLEVYGFLSIHRRSEDVENDLWQLDQRGEWWTRYALAIGADEEIPPAFKAAELAPITHEPLLCYLLVLAGYAGDKWRLAAANPNLIYQTLMEDIYCRGWGDGLNKRHGPGKTMTLKDFLLLMETIGLAAWLGGDARVASDASFNEAVEIMNAQQAWSRFNQDNGSDVTNLAMNFYLKSSESTHRGFEFTHKSFGEYLAACAILRVALNIHDLARRRVDLIMTEWARATSTGVITPEILTFLRNEVRLRCSNAPFSVDEFSAVKEAFQIVAETAMTDGFPIQGGVSFRNIEKRQCHSELACWSILNSTARGIAEFRDSKAAMINVNWPNRYAMRAILMRSNDVPVWSTIIASCFAFVNAADQYIYSCEIYDGDFSGANLQEANFTSVQMINCSFAQASMRGVDFDGAKVSASDFSSADLSYSSFLSARLDQVKFTDAIVKSMKVNLETIALSDEGLFKERQSDIAFEGEDIDNVPLSIERVSEAAVFVSKLRPASQEDYSDPERTGVA